MHKDKRMIENYGQHLKMMKKPPHLEIENECTSVATPSSLSGNILNNFGNTDVNSKT